MHNQHISESFRHWNIPMIDREFDRFELNNDLSGSLHEAQTATFYHGALDLEE